MQGQGLAGRNLISLLDFDPDGITKILDVAVEMRANPDHFADALCRRTLFMYFEKPSLRTRVTFEAGMTQLGGHAIYYTGTDGKIGVRESVEDVARNLGRWVDVAMMRTFSHQLVEEVARFSGIPVINGLTDLLHPCQALADFQTLRQVRGKLAGQHLVYVGDGNNVAHSLMNGGAQLGVHVTIVTPEGHAPDPTVLKAAAARGEKTGARIQVSHDVAAVEGADAIYTDVWASMGQESEAEARKKLFAPLQVNAEMMARAKDDAIFMHCLPAHRGDEVTSEVADSAASVIFEQAENRLHAQKALLVVLLGAE